MVKRKKKDESGDGQNDIVEKGSNSLMMGGFSALLSSFLMVDKKAKVSEALHYHRQLHIVAWAMFSAYYSYIIILIRRTRVYSRVFAFSLCRQASRAQRSGGIEWAANVRYRTRYETP